MSFMSFTLYPGGSFMMCESISEFDPNVEPDEQSAQPVVAGEMYKSPEACITNRYDGDYLNSLLLQLKSIYATDVSYLLNLNMETYDEGMVAALLENIGNATNRIATNLRSIAVEARTMYNMVHNNQTRTDYIYGPIKNNLGMFVKNMQKISRLGYDSMYYTVTEHPTFRYASQRLVLTIIENPELISGVIDTHTLDSLIDSSVSEFDKYFESTVDMMDVFLGDDPSRRVRQERQDHRSFYISDFIQYNLSDGMSHNIASDNAGSDGFCKFMGYLSTTLRHIKRKVYDMQTELLDDNQRLFKHLNEDVYELAKASVNMFILSMIFLVSIGYDVNQEISTHIAIENYVNEVQRALR